MEVLNYIIENVEAMVAGAVLILGGMALLAKLTPSPVDDKWIAKILAFLKLVPVKNVAAKKPE